jgi:hypothetical protein
VSRIVGRWWQLLGQASVTCVVYEILLVHGLLSCESNNSHNNNKIAITTTATLSLPACELNACTEIFSSDLLKFMNNFIFEEDFCVFDDTNQE